MKIKLTQNGVLLLVLIVLAISFRAPFLAYCQGLNDGDDGLVILQAKHIAEGELPSIYNYGIISESSTLMHVYALLFKIFGYSLMILRLAALSIFIAFIVVQFFMLTDIFPRDFAILVCLFYCLPIGHTMISSLNLSGDFPSILFLGSLMMFLSFRIYNNNKEKLIPFLGFIIGLAFWVHQMTVSFILTSLVLFAVKYRMQIKKYFHLAGYAVVGGFPVVISEVMTRFSLINFLLSGKFIRMDFSTRLKRTLEMLTFLISRQDNALKYFYLLLIFAAIAGFIFALCRQKSFSPYGIYVLFFAVFFIIYFLSKFSSKPILSVRYFYPLYFALPIFLFGVILPIKTRIRTVCGVLLLFMLLVFNNLKGFSQDFIHVKQAHKNLKQAVQAVQDTGEKYWVGDFWDSFLVTALSGEKVIACENALFGHYPPYSLFYNNDGRNNNFLFLNEVGVYSLAYKEMLDLISDNLDQKLKRARQFIQFLERSNIGFKKRELNNNLLLVYDIEEDIPIVAWNMKLPEKIPELSVENMEYSRGLLSITFKKQQPTQDSGFRLHVEIPGYSSDIKPVKPNEEVVIVKIPCPRKRPPYLRYFLDFYGIKIPFTLHEYPFPDLEVDMEKNRGKILWLSGVWGRIKFEGREYRICGKEVRIEVNKPAGKSLHVNLRLHSPFKFADPQWYKEYKQTVRVEINGRFLIEKKLNDGNNSIVIDGIDQEWQRKNGNIFTLKFKYHMPFIFFPYYKTAALVESIE